ncbi:hypothetical protein [Actinacidiphila glaucinigra]|uniref:Uncharacterized protein n=1 Tax=Actinacidiphila glaucinigra TaxID=235986 RepID=A0A239IVE5_9ACTN|nr:hypothetical protein [Actinacidiphila glaucinigra]SNS97549.1 hypothetical protein SAMN05216252_111148 [Actinacidiphila glaucinigra]
MGASGWSYVTPYRGSVGASLEALQGEVFAQEYGDGEEYSTIEELYADEEFMEEEGTHSILDVRRVVESTKSPRESCAEDYFTVRPLAPARLLIHFGTDRPTVQQYEDAIAHSYTLMGARRRDDRDTSLLEEDKMRWTGVYVLLHADDQPTHVGFFGSSGD